MFNNSLKVLLSLCNNTLNTQIWHNKLYWHTFFGRFVQ